MEAVRLGLPPEVTRKVQEYASDRIGIHPTARMWDEGVDRRIAEYHAVVWTIFDNDEIGRIVFRGYSYSKYGLLFLP